MSEHSKTVTEVVTTVPWWKKNKSLTIGGIVVILVVILACGWLAIRPQINGTYYGYLGDKREVKLVINKEGRDTKKGYLEYTSSSQTGRALKRFTKALDQNETVINQYGDYLKDDDSFDLKKLMNSDLYKNYLEKQRMPLEVVKHKGNWYMQLDQQVYTDAGFSQSDVNDMLTNLSKHGKYSKENKIDFGFHKFVIGTEKENNTFYRAKYKPIDPADWTNKKYEKETADDFNDAADELDELASMVDTMRDVAALGELDDLLNDTDDSDIDTNGHDADDKDDDIDSSDAEDVNYTPTMQQHLVFE